MSIIKYECFSDVMPKKDWRNFKRGERQKAKQEIDKELKEFNKYETKNPAKKTDTKKLFNKLRNKKD